MASPPTLKLTYFDLPARAEATRVVLRLGGISFEDERISRAHFAAIKATLPYGHVPVLDVDGELLAETQAIFRYASRIAGFYPLDDAVAALLVEEILTAIQELSETKMVPMIREKDPEKVKSLLRAFMATHLPTALAQVEARLQYMATYAFFQHATQLYAHEIGLSILIGLLQTHYSQFVPPNFLDGFPTIMATHEKVVGVIAAPRSPPPRPTFQHAKEVPRPTKLKLTYLHFKARGEFLRLALHIGGVPFEDERLTYQEVTDRKALLPYGQVPVLNIDGRVMAQTFALLRYAGTVSGLYPIQTNPLEAAKMDEIIARVEEIYHAIQPSYAEKDMDKRRSMREQLLEAGVLQNVLASLETRVTQWKKPATPYIFGENVTLADLVVYHIVDYTSNGEFDFIPLTITKEFQTLVAVRDAVVAHPRVQDWYKSHGP